MFAIQRKRAVVFLFILSTLCIWSRPKTDNFSNPIERETLVYADTLKLDFYSQQGNVNSQRALLLLVHGGGFSGGSRDNPIETDFAKKMAAQGYAVASISYRLTRKNKSFGCDCPALEKVQTFVASAEDVTKAIQFLLQKEDYFQFDSQKIVLMGSSAGAEAVLNTAFMGKDYRFEHLEKVPIAGVISLSGATLDKNYITKQNAVPILFIHGEKDNLVPFTTAPHHNCNAKDVGYLVLDGPKAIAAQLKKLQIPYILASDPEGNHDWANLGYAEINLIHLFMEKIITEKVFMEKEIELSHF